jgi:hypothetical protein
VPWSEWAPSFLRDRCAGIGVGNVAIPPRVGARVHKPTPTVGNVRICAWPGATTTFWTRDPGRRHLPALLERYAQAVSKNLRIERGWIFVDGTRQDDGTIKLGTGGEMRFSPFDAMSQRQDTHITWGNILTASVQRLAFWRR